MCSRCREWERQRRNRFNEALNKLGEVVKEIIKSDTKSESANNIQYPKIEIVQKAIFCLTTCAQEKTQLSKLHKYNFTFFQHMFTLFLHFICCSSMVLLYHIIVFYSCYNTFIHLSYIYINFQHYIYFLFYFFICFTFYIIEILLPCFALKLLYIVPCVFYVSNMV